MKTQSILKLYMLLILISYFPEMKWKSQAAIYIQGMRRVKCYLIC